MESPSVINKNKALGIGILAGGLLASAIGAAGSNTWLGMSIMTIGILGIGLVLGHDIGRKHGRKEIAAF